MDARLINWLENTAQSIESHHPVLKRESKILATRLSALMLERLPSETSTSIFNLLPESMQKNSLEQSALSVSDRSIGYPDFVERTLRTIGMSDMINKEIDLDHLAREIADLFLWVFPIDFPPDLKSEMLQSLPIELSSRMNLYNVVPEESKVA